MAVQQGITLDPNPQMVGNAFVTLYYNVLNISPQMVHKGLQLTRSARCKWSNDHSNYYGGKGILCMNDIFRYVDEEQEQPKQNLALLNGNVNHATEAPTPEPVVESEPVAENGVIEQPMTVVEELVVEEHNHMQKREIPYGLADKKESAIGRLPAAVQEEGPPTRETSVVIQDAPKKSYASIVKVMKENAALSVAVQKPSLAKAVPSAERQATSSSPPKASANEPSSSTAVDMTDNIVSPEAEGNACSIYIKHLPGNVTPAQVEEEFKKFGAIKQNGVQVRSKQGGFCFGFVEFEKAASLQTALQASPITINGWQAFVEEKKTTSSTRATRGWPFPVRWGFKNDGIRVRGAYAGRGYGRTDFANGAYGGQGNGRADFVNRADFRNRARGSLSGRAGWFSDAPEGYQRDNQI